MRKPEGDVTKRSHQVFRTSSDAVGIFFGIFQKQCFFDLQFTGKFFKGGAALITREFIFIY